MSDATLRLIRYVSRPPNRGKTHEKVKSDIVRYLNEGADVSAVGFLGNDKEKKYELPILILAIRSFHHVKVIRKLIECGSDPNVVDSNGYNSIMHAIEAVYDSECEFMNQYNVLETLISNSGNMYHVNAAGESVLQCAWEGGFGTRKFNVQSLMVKTLRQKVRAIRASGTELLIKKEPLFSECLKFFHAYSRDYFAFKNYVNEFKVDFKTVLDLVVTYDAIEVIQALIPSVATIKTFDKKIQRCFTKDIAQVRSDKSLKKIILSAAVKDSPQIIFYLMQNFGELDELANNVDMVEFYGRMRHAGFDTLEEFAAFSAKSKTISVSKIPEEHEFGLDDDEEEAFENFMTNYTNKNVRMLSPLRVPDMEADGDMMPPLDLEKGETVTSEAPSENKIEGYDPFADDWDLNDDD